MPEIGYPLVHSFSVTDYNAASQNWAIAQSPNGFIYVGNNEGVLEFDGKNWRTYRIPNSSTVKSLAINEKGDVFVGTENEFGILKPDSTHTLHYVSLMSQIPKEKSNFTDVWQTFAAENKVYFRTAEHIFIFKDKKLEKIIDPKDKFHTGFFTNNTFYVKDHAEGVLKLNQNNELEPIAGQLGGEKNVYGVFEENDELMVFFRTEGILKIKNKIASLQKTQSTEILTETRAYCSVKLSENQFAIGTIRNGVFITDKKGTILLHLNEENILTNNAIYAMFLDKDKNLWLATDNGIDCIYLGIPYSTLGAVQGIKGKGLNIEYSPFYQKMYIGTTTGVYQNNFPQKVDSADGKQTKFELLEGTEGYALSVLNQNRILYYGHNLGMFQVKDNVAKIIDLGERGAVTWGIVPTSDSTKFIKLHNKGIALAKKGINENKWTEKIYLNFDQSIRYLVQNYNYWWTSNDKDLFRLTFSENYDSLLEVKTYSDKLGNDFFTENKIVEINNKLFFINGKKVYLYDTQKDEFVISNLFDSYFEGNQVIYLKEDEEGNIWYTLQKEKTNERGILWKQKESTTDFVFVQQKDFTKAVSTVLTNSLLPNQKIAFGVEDGFLIIDAKKEFRVSEKINVKVRKVEFLGETDSLLFGGVFFDSDSLVIENQPKNQELKLEYDFNALRFSFASPYFIFAEKTEYRYKLKGLDNKWSAWSEKNQKEYTNLSNGKYQFVVQARNIWGVESDEIVYKFEIYPPVYFTWWAYLIYLILLALLIWVVIKQNLYRLQREKARLARLVKQRTSQLEEQNKTVIEQSEALLLQNNNIKSSISYASRIQQAMLPPIEGIKNSFDDAFVLWLPRDIVSGDFYFFAKVENKICIAAIDCTGHGVPGAFMSMIGNDLLNQIIIENKITEPSEILTQLHLQVVSSLRQTETQNRDGMDMAICIYDETTKELSFAGAKSPLYYIQDGQIKDIAGSKSPIGGKWGEKNKQVYQTHILSIKEEITFFLCTDGYQDQFGGKENKKLMRKQMKSLFLEVAHLEGKDQREKLETYFLNWKKEEEQIDDVLVIGFKIGKKQ
jgi:serine phosphatase RsbU (regulator of sigma subunit)